MCGHHGDGSATRLATLLIKTCQRLRVPYTRGCVFPFPVNVFVPARVRAGKGAVYEIIYAESAAAAGGAAQLESCRKHWKNINQPAVCTKVENIIDVSLF